MARRTHPRIQIVSHGPACFDGVVAAVAVARFYQGYNVTPIFAANQDSDRIIRELGIRNPGDEIWITDLSWTELETGLHLRRLAEAGARVFWIDHHRSAIRRAEDPEFQVPFAGKLISEQYSAARLVFEFIAGSNPVDGAGGANRAAHAALGTTDGGDGRRMLESFFPIIELADDHDRWVHRLPDSEAWALAVQTLGAANSYKEMIKLGGPLMTRPLSQALDAGRRAMAQSLALAQGTVAERALGGGLSLVTACCFGYSSEVAASLYGTLTNSIVALLDMRSGGVSLRRSADCQTDLSLIASALGGGGHAAAAGFVHARAKAALAAELSEIIGDSISQAMHPAK